MVFYKKEILVQNTVLYLMYVFSMYVAGNRRAFLHVHNFKAFVDELYRVRMYEDQT